MAYFTQDFISFFEELAENNHKEWFDANRKRYVKSVKEPFAAFVGDMIDRVKEEDPKIMITPKDAIFRINRDIRFSKDKTPYKTNVSAIISRGGRKDKTYPGMYFELKPAEVRYYGGAHMLDKEQLYKVRSAMAADLSGFEDVLNDKTFKKTFQTIHGEKNKRIPKEFQEAAERQALIANKSFYYYSILPASLLLSDKLADELMDCYQAGKPMMQWLADAMQ